MPSQELEIDYIEKIRKFNRELPPKINSSGRSNNNFRFILDGVDLQTVLTEFSQNYPFFTRETFICDGFEILVGESYVGEIVVDIDLVPPWINLRALILNL